LKWFKLLLLDSDHLPDHFRHAPNLIEAQAQMKEMNKSPVDVIADYLRLLWAHSLEQITRAVTTIVMDRVKLKVVVTMPAIWPLYARLRMKEAVKMAGIMDPRCAGETSLSFMSEPEAAALAALADVDEQTIIEVRENTEQYKTSLPGSNSSNKTRNNLILSYAMLVVVQW
jgi:molecular chaperone DnaK (HSP70)